MLPIIIYRSFSTRFVPLRRFARDANAFERPMLNKSSPVFALRINRIVMGLFFFCLFVFLRALCAAAFQNRRFSWQVKNGVDLKMEMR